MAYDEDLADRMREALAGTRGLSEIKMFGGLCFTINGNMAGGVHKDDMIVRMDADAGDRALKEAGARLMDITHRPMRGFLMVSREGWKTKRQLEKWVRRGADFASALPPKAKKKKKAPKSG